jgi:hypothetical protein
MWRTAAKSSSRAIVKVGTLTNGAYQFQDFTGTQVIKSPTFPALTLTAAQVLSAGKEKAGGSNPSYPLVSEI